MKRRQETSDQQLRQQSAYFRISYSLSFDSGLCWTRRASLKQRKANEKESQGQRSGPTFVILFQTGSHIL